MAYSPAYAAAQGRQQFDAALVGASSVPVAAERGVVITTKELDGFFQRDLNPARIIAELSVAVEGIAGVDADRQRIDGLEGVEARVGAGEEVANWHLD